MTVRKIMKYSLSEAEKIALNTALDIIDKVADNFGETTTFEYTDFDTAADTINSILEGDNEDLLDQVGEFRPFPFAARGRRPRTVFGITFNYTKFFACCQQANCTKIFSQNSIFSSLCLLQLGYRCAIIIEQGKGTGVAHTEQKIFKKFKKNA